MEQNDTGAGWADMIKRLQEEREAAAKGGYLPSYPAPAPCPNCGRCPTCGRRGRYTITYGYPGYTYL